MIRSLGKLFVSFFVAGILFICPAASHAAVSTGDFIKFSDSFGSLGGGEFLINNLTHPTNPKDISFCVQTNEFIDFTHTFYVAGIETFATNEPDSPGGKDPLDAITAYMFYHFTKGDLSNYAFNGTAAQRAASADALQYAIWKIENESLPSVSLAIKNQANAWIAEATNAITNNKWTGIGNVRVAHLFYAKLNNQGKWTPDYTKEAQDQLVVLPEPPPGQPVPEPASVVTWLTLGLGAVVARKWQKRRV